MINTKEILFNNGYGVFIIATPNHSKRILEPFIYEFAIFKITENGKSFIETQNCEFVYESRLLSIIQEIKSL